MNISSILSIAVGAMLLLASVGCGANKQVLHWKVNETGITGHGEPLDEELAKAWLKHSKATDKTCSYWLETVDYDPTEAD